MDIPQLLNLGIGGVSIFMLAQVWSELKAVNKFNRDMLTELMEDRRAASAQRQALMQANGIDPKDSGIYRRADLGLPPLGQEVKPP